MKVFNCYLIIDDYYRGEYNYKNHYTQVLNKIFPLITNKYIFNLIDNKEDSDIIICPYDKYNIYNEIYSKISKLGDKSIGSTSSYSGRSSSDKIGEIIDNYNSIISNNSINSNISFDTSNNVLNLLNLIIISLVFAQEIKMIVKYLN